MDLLGGSPMSPSSGLLDLTLNTPQMPSPLLQHTQNQPHLMEQMSALTIDPMEGKQNMHRFFKYHIGEFDLDIENVCGHYELFLTWECFSNLNLLLLSCFGCVRLKRGFLTGGM